MEYFDDDIYDDLFDEPSEADKIISEAETSLMDLLKADVRQCLSSWGEKQTQLDRLNNQIREKQHELAMINEKISNANKKMEQTEIELLPKKYADRFIQKYTKGVVPGQKIWVLNYNWKSKVCPMCKGKKKLTVDFDGKPTIVDCPICHASGRVDDNCYTVEESFVREVHMELFFRSNSDIGIWTARTVTVRGKDYPIDSKEFFLTEEEAREECDRLNQKEE